MNIYVNVTIAGPHIYIYIHTRITDRYDTLNTHVIYINTLCLGTRNTLTHSLTRTNTIPRSQLVCCFFSRMCVCVMCMEQPCKTYIYTLHRKRYNVRESCILTECECMWMRSMMVMVKCEKRARDETVIIGHIYIHRTPRNRSWNFFSMLSAKKKKKMKKKREEFGDDVVHFCCICLAIYDDD